MFDVFPSDSRFLFGLRPSVLKTEITRERERKRERERERERESVCVCV